MSVQKSFIIKIFDQDGSTFLKSLTSDKPADDSLPYVKNTPDFPSYINGGLGECVLDLAYPFDDFDEGGVVDFMNIVEIFAVTPIYPLGTLIYSGFMSKYDPYIESGSEGVKVTCLGFVSILPASFYEDGDLTVEHTGEDPETIGRAIIDHVNTVFGGDLLSYDASTTDSVGTNVSITFTDQKWSDALKKVVELAGAGWWWKLDENRKYWLKAKPSSATHIFTIGKDIERLHGEKDGEKVVNEVYVRRSGDVETVYSDPTSQARFGTGNPATGKRSKLITDSSLGDLNAADQRGNKELDDGKLPKVVSPFTVNDNYDLESIKVGQTCKIVNHQNTDFFGSNMLIVGLTYHGDTVDIQLEDTSSSFTRELATFVQNNTSGGTSSGSSGASSGSPVYVREDLSSVVDGVTTTFPLLHTPVADSELIYLQGILQNEGAGNDYTVSGSNLVFAQAPLSSPLIAFYRTTDGTLNFGKESFTGDGVTTTFALAQTPIANTEMVFVNGVFQNSGASNDYTVSGSSIVFNALAKPASNAVIVVVYQY
jgi:hypothetical protein